MALHLSMASSTYVGWLGDGCIVVPLHHEDREPCSSLFSAVNALWGLWPCMPGPLYTSIRKVVLDGWDREGQLPLEAEVPVLSEQVLGGEDGRPQALGLQQMYASWTAVWSI